MNLYNPPLETRDKLEECAMPDSADLVVYKLEEVRRVMRKQLAAWCNPKNLTPDQIAAVNEIIASNSAARYPNVAAVLNGVDLGKALQGKTISEDSAEKLFIASVLQVCDKIGIKLKKTGWPASLNGKTIETLSSEVLQ